MSNILYVVLYFSGFILFSGAITGIGGFIRVLFYTRTKDFPNPEIMQCYICYRTSSSMPTGFWTLFIAGLILFGVLRPQSAPDMNWLEFCMLFGLMIAFILLTIYSDIAGTNRGTKYRLKQYYGWTMNHQSQCPPIL